MKRVAHRLLRPVLPLIDRPGKHWLRARGQRAFEQRRFHTALRLWQRGVAVGDVESAFRLADVYQNGYGAVYHNPARAAAWYKFAAERGHAELQLRLGRIFLHGASARRLGEKWERTARDEEMAAATAEAIFAATPKIERDTTQALFWLEKAGRQGLNEAWALTGMIFLDGVGVEKDFERARQYFLMAADHDQASAQFGLGEIYYRGLGVEPNLELGADWYQKAADLGHTRAQIAIATIYLSGKGRDIDPERAAFYMGRAGEAGDASAAYSYGRMRLNGEGGPVDVDCAETYLRRAAKAGYVPAIRALAAFYSQGGLVPPDLREAANWYRVLAESGDVQAQFTMGRFTAEGLGVGMSSWRGGAVVCAGGGTGSCDRRL